MLRALSMEILPLQIKVQKWWIARQPSVKWRRVSSSQLWKLKTLFMRDYLQNKVCSGSSSQQQPVIWSFRFSLICLRRGRRDNVWMMRSVSPEPGCCRDKSQVFSSSFDIIESIYLWTCERDNNLFGTFIEIWESRIYQIYNVVQLWLCCAALLLD